MKHLKYTVAALAVIAVASFTPSAMAGGNQGDIILGIYDTTGNVGSSFEVDLGAYNSLTSGESWNLGSVIETTYSSDSSANLSFDIAGAGGSGAEGLGSKQIAYTAVTAPGSLNTTTPNTDLSTYSTGGFTGTSVTLPSTTSSTGVTDTALLVSNSSTGAAGHSNEVNGGFQINSGIGIDGTYTLPAPSLGTLYSFYTQNSSAAPVLDGTFEFSEVGGNDILTFDPTAVPEPSAYDLVLCAVALFWVLKRRHTAA